MELNEMGTLEELQREEYVQEQARRALAKAEGKAEHRFAPEPGKNVCKVCGQSYGQGNHTPMSSFDKSELVEIQKDWAAWDAAHKEGGKLTRASAVSALKTHPELKQVGSGRFRHSNGSKINVVSAHGGHMVHVYDRNGHHSNSLSVPDEKFARMGVGQATHAHLKQAVDTVARGGNELSHLKPVKKAEGEGGREPVRKDWAKWDAEHKGAKLSTEGAHQALLSHGFTHQQSLKYGPHNVPNKKDTEDVSFYNHPSGRVGVIVSGGKRGTQASVLASGKAYFQPTLAHKAEKAGHTNAEFHRAVGEAMAKPAGKHGQPSRPFSPPRGKVQKAPKKG